MSMQATDFSAPPAWAVQRVATVIERSEAAARYRHDAKQVAQKAGVSKSLARRCMMYLAARK